MTDGENMTTPHDLICLNCDSTQFEIRKICINCGADGYSLEIATMAHVCVYCETPMMDTDQMNDFRKYIDEHTKNTETRCPSD